MENAWRRCSSCKREIGFEKPHWVCSVSTCNRPRTGLAFCSVGCWDAHVPVMRHRDNAGALERRSPSRAAFERERAAEAQAAQDAKAANEAKARAAAPPPRPSAAQRPSAPPKPAAQIPREVLVVASKLKAYIRARAEMNTSDAVMDVLSDRIRRISDRAIERAQREGRKTVLERDFE